MNQFITFVLLSIFIGSGPVKNKDLTRRELTPATCYGYTPCNACKTCNYCRYCNSGGTCGICAPYKKKKTSSEPAIPTRCKAITKKGTRCKRAARSNGYCWQHGGWSHRSKIIFLFYNNEPLKRIIIISQPSINLPKTGLLLLFILSVIYVSSQPSITLRRTFDAGL